jgi:hypothetical protein
MKNVLSKVGSALVATTMLEKEISQEYVNNSKELTINKFEEGLGSVLKKALNTH